MAFPDLTVLTDPIVFIALCSVIGLIIGSFLNVVIHRLPRMMESDWRRQCAELAGTPPMESAEPYNLATPRSACPHCGHAITFWENIPVISWLALRGRCSACGASIGMRYPLVELATAVLFGLAAWQFGAGFQAVAVLLFIACLLALTVIDLDTQYLPDAITLPLCWAGLLVNIPATLVELPAAVIGAVAGYLSLWLVYWGFKWITGKEGMGFGDFKLLAAIGAWLGWKMLPLVILASSVVGTVVGIVMIVLAGRTRETPIPFGPYLAAAGLIALFGGPQIVAAYLNQFN